MSNHCLFSETGVETGHRVTKVHILESTSERPGCCGGCRAGELPGARVQPSPATPTPLVVLGRCLQGRSVPAASPTWLFLCSGDPQAARLGRAVSEEGQPCSWEAGAQWRSGGERGTETEPRCSRCGR